MEIGASSIVLHTEKGSFLPRRKKTQLQTRPSVRRPLSLLLSTRVNSLFLSPFLPPSEGEGSPLPIGRTDGPTDGRRGRGNGLAEDGGPFGAKRRSAGEEVR